MLIARASFKSLFYFNRIVRKMSLINVCETPALKPHGVLFQHQASLPTLPVPTLQETLSKYLRTVQPLVTEDEWAMTKKKVDAFLHEGVGNTLQARLLERAEKTNKTSSWLYDWWNEYAYFGYRDPTVIHVNYFFHFQDDPRRTCPLARSASLIQAIVAFREKVVTQTLEPEMARHAPLCSIQYQAMFHACRIPSKPSDHVLGYSPEHSSHVLVIRNNKFFVFDVLRKGQPLSEEELKIQLKRIMDMAGTEKDLPLGVLTTEHRDTWADLRTQLLQSHPSHARLLEKIQSAMFVLCLDEAAPVTREECARVFWHGDGRNRWFDKSLQFIVCANGKAGFNGEHSLMDATPTGRLCEWILKYSPPPSSLSPLPAEPSPPGTAAVSLFAVPEQLRFHLEGMRAAIQLAEHRVDQLIQKHEVQVLAYAGYGKHLIKQFGVSPDAFVQLALQWAYWKMYGTCKPTYETAQTRKFAFGRTETGRSVSMASVAFVQAMRQVGREPEKIQCLKAAARAHHQYMLEASEGKGVDRHLLGLRLCVQPHEPLPSLFDAVYTATCHWTLSTSQLTSEAFDGYGWGAVVPDGYGLAYMIKNNSIHVNIACQHLGAQRFRHHLTEALDEMRHLFEVMPPPKSKL